MLHRNIRWRNLILLLTHAMTWTRIIANDVPMNFFDIFLLPEARRWWRTWKPKFYLIRTYHTYYRISTYKSKNKWIHRKTLLVASKFCVIHILIRLIYSWNDLNCWNKLIKVVSLLRMISFFLIFLMWTFRFPQGFLEGCQKAINWISTCRYNSKTRWPGEQDRKWQKDEACINCWVFHPGVNFHWWPNMS